MKAYKDDSGLSRQFLNLIELDKNEEVVTSVRKHPIGLLAIYLTGLFVSAGVVFAGVIAGLWIDDNNNFESGFEIGMILTIASAILAVLVLFFTFVSGFVYQHNVIIVTTDKIAQVLYRNLIDRKISQLALGELQDVTIDQRGLFARVFKYGTLTIETAGEQNNYVFTYTPYPYDCAKQIVAAREESIRKYGN